MNNSNLRKFAWVLFALALTTTSVFAQGWRNTNRVNQNRYSCLNVITGLSEDQKSQILEMEETHQENMAEMRINQRSTNNLAQKNEIRGEMDKMVEAHRNAVKDLLNENQQQQYNLLHANNAYGNQQNWGNYRGNRNFRGQGQFAGNLRSGRGNGNGRFYQNNTNCLRNGTGFANNGRGRNVRLYGQGRNRNFQQSNGRYYQQNNANYIENQSSENEIETTEEK